MRDKLALTIALTAFAVALGAGLAGAAPLVDTTGTGVNVPGTSLQVPLPPCPAGVLPDPTHPDCIPSVTSPPPPSTPPPTSTTTPGSTTGTTTTGSTTGTNQSGSNGSKGSKGQTLHN